MPLVTCSTPYHFLIQLQWLLRPGHAKRPQPSASLPGVSRGSHQMRTLRYFPFNSFLQNSQQNKPSLPVCLFTVAKPTHPFQHPQVTGPHLSKGRTVKMWLGSAQAHAILQQMKTPTFYDERFPLLLAYLNFSCFISLITTYWP